MKKRIFRPFVIMQIPKIEKWLKSQAEKGLKLTAYKLGCFTFESCNAKKREYFVFVDFLADKKSVFFTELFLLKKAYGKRNSLLNKNNDTVIEIDSQKIDKNYKYSLLARTNYYIKQYFQWSIMQSVLLFLSAVASFLEGRLIPLTILFFITTMYSLTSMLVLKYQKRSQNTNIL